MGHCADVARVGQGDALSSTWLFHISSWPGGKKGLCSSVARAVCGHSDPWKITLQELPGGDGLGMGLGMI